MLAILCQRVCVHAAVEYSHTNFALALGVKETPRLTSGGMCRYSGRKEKYPPPFSSPQRTVFSTSYPRRVTFLHTFESNFYNREAQKSMPTGEQIMSTSQRFEAYVFSDMLARRFYPLRVRTLLF